MLEVYFSKPCNADVFHSEQCGAERDVLFVTVLSAEWTVLEISESLSELNTIQYSSGGGGCRISMKF
jgi:hypothetical protein